MANNTDVIGTIETGFLSEFFGQQIVVKKSSRATRYPLYLSTRCGPLFFNSRPGQDFLLEHSRIDGARTEAQEPERDTPPAPEKPAEKPKEDARPRSALARFFSDDGDI